MKERIQQIMKMEHMTQQDFAKAIEISAASLSNIFNGKTNPTNNHVRAIHRHFPTININWLMFGEGNMYATNSNETNYETKGNSEHIPQTNNALSPTLSNPNAGNKPTDTSNTNKVGTNNEPQTNTNLREVIKYIDKPQRKITEIRVFFDDGTYEVYS